MAQTIWMPELVSDKRDLDNTAAVLDLGGIELFAFGSYLVRRWRAYAIVLALVLPITLIGSGLLPKKYTATSSVLIDPPAGNDPRASTAVSPVYFESLKTYEHFASSDSLFEKAIKELNLRRASGNVPIEVLKRRLLKITKLRDTKILQIEASGSNPVMARDLATYIASATVQLNRSLDAASTSELTTGGDSVLAIALRHLNAAKQAGENGLANEPVGVLEADVAAANELKNYLLRELSASQTELAAYDSRSASGKQGPAYVDSKEALEAVAASRAEVVSLSNQLAKLEAELREKSALLEIRKKHRELREKDLAIAQQQFDAATNQRNDILESIAFRGERLAIIDPGVLPEKPSSPNVPLNVGIGVLLSLVGCTFYLALSFARQHPRFY